MKRICLLAPAALALCGVSTAAAASGINYDCDTAPDHFSVLELPTGEGAFTVSGDVQLKALAGSKKFAGITRVQIASTAAPEGSPSAFAGFSLSALPADEANTSPGAPGIQTLSYNASGTNEDAMPRATLDPGAVEHFTISYDGSNVAVDLGTTSKTFIVTMATPVLRIVCSTGEFLFTNLTIEPHR
jgi:hypothetical protein